jgi:hypothetical protein
MRATECVDEVEDACHEYRGAGLQRSGRNRGGYRVGCVVKAVVKSNSAVRMTTTMITRTTANPRGRGPPTVVPGWAVSPGGCW